MQAKMGQPAGGAEGCSASASGAARGVLFWGMVAFPAMLGLMAILFFRYQVLCSQEILDRCDSQMVRRANVSPERGTLTATGGENLCYNQPVYRFVLDLKALRHPRETLAATVDRVGERLAAFRAIFPPGSVSFSLSERQIADRIREEGALDFVLGEDWDVPPALVARYAPFQDQFPEIRLEPASRRVCIASPALANTLGRVTSDLPTRRPEGHLDYIRPELRGVSGLEHALDGYLRGESGYEEIAVDALGYHPVSTVETEPAKSGWSVRLTFDLPVQEAAERLFLAGDAGAFVVLELPGMEVRAMGGAPQASYAPTPTDYVAMKDGTAEGGMQDLARTWRTPPGSTFKMITFAAALMSGKMAPDEKILCTGHCIVNGVSRPCSKAHGWVTPAEALAQSCNVATYEAAKRAGGEAVVFWAHQFGFGEDYRFQEGNLMLGRSRVLEARRWTDTALWNLGIGQGETEASVVSLAMYAGTLVTGELVRPTYVEESSLPVGDRGGHNARVVRQVVLRPEVRDVLLQGMLACTQSGTGRSAACGGVQILGKTGTAESGPKEARRKNALMVALVPAGAPKYCIVCAIKDSQAGGGSTVGPRMRGFVQELIGLGRLSSLALAGEE